MDTFSHLPFYFYFFRCYVFFVGDKFVAVNSSVEVRAGQSMEFACPENYYVANAVS